LSLLARSVHGRSDDPTAEIIDRRSAKLVK